jgi:hypothetical protein
MELAAHAYQRYIKQNFPADAAQQLYQKIKVAADAAQMDFHKMKKRYIQDFENLYLSKDLEVLCDLLDNGYSMRDVMEAYTHQNSFANEFHEEDAIISQYEDKVLSLVNDERKKRVGREYEKAKDVYLAYLENNQNKYAGHEDAFSAYHEGEIIISMLVQDGFAEETIHTVLQNASQHDSTYIKTMMEKCGHVKQAYLDIQSAGVLDDARNEFDVFRSFAKSYMERTGTKLLGFDDELQIVKEMRAEKFPDPFLKPALLKASPVAMEPGRNPQEYVEALISSDVDLENSLLPGLEKGAFVNTSDVYMDLIEQYQEQLTAAGILTGINEKNRIYYDCLAVRELLQRCQPEKDIMQALEDKSPEASNLSLNYAMWMVEKAKKLLKKEQTFLQMQVQNTPDHGSYQSLLSKGITAKEIYQAILRTRLELNPSLSQKLYASFMDKDMAEACMHLYPDFDKDALAGIIQESPRAILLSGTRLPEERNYAENVIQEASKRLVDVGQRQEQEKSIFMEFNRQRGLVSQGVVEAKNAMSAFQWGRSALQMLMKGYDLFTIRKAIIDTADPLDKSPEAFADDILEKTPKVYDRLMQVKNYVPVEHPKTAEEYYRKKLFKYYQKRHAVKSSMDVSIVKDMLARNIFHANDIHNAIKDFSPIAIEPGRDENYYYKYVLPNGRNKYMEEKDKLKYYKPIPRLEHEESAVEEYKYHKEQMEEAIDLPYTMQMDKLIAETMLVQGFLMVDIIQALSIESPCRDEQSNYGLCVVNRAKQSFEQSFEREEVNTRSLVRNVSITDTDNIENDS